jgi:predicted dehydrogenase
MADKLRWGFLGTARIAGRLARAVRASGNGGLVAVASRNLARARQWAAEYDVPIAYASYSSLIESDKVDAIYNPLPNSMHLEWTVRAARAGKHILCEKPLAMNAAEVAQMIEAAKRYGVLLMEAFMYRFHPQYHQLEELLAQGAIGPVRRFPLGEGVGRGRSA